MNLSLAHVFQIFTKRSLATICCTLLSVGLWLLLPVSNCDGFQLLPQGPGGGQSFGGGGSGSGEPSTGGGGSGGGIDGPIVGYGVFCHELSSRDGNEIAAGCEAIFDVLTGDLCCPCWEGACAPTTPTPPAPPMPVPPTPCSPGSGGSSSGDGGCGSGGCDAEEDGTNAGNTTSCLTGRAGSAMETINVEDFCVLPLDQICSSCSGGGSADSRASSDLGLHVNRRMLPANQSEQFSHGRGMQLDYDMRLTLYPSDTGGAAVRSGA